MSVRSELAAQFATDWASIPGLSDVRVVATERKLDDIRTFTALIRARSITRSTAAPNSHRDVSVLLTLISPHLNADVAQDDLDERAEAILDYLDTRYRHEGATSAGWANERFAYDIPITILASKE